MQKTGERRIAHSPQGARFFQAPGVAVFFVCFFLYVWLQVDPVIEYYADGIVFSLGRRFFHPFLAYPGGLSQYAATFLAQLNYYSWLGALVLTVLGAAIFGEAAWLLRGTSGNKREATLVCLVPSLILLAWRGRLDGHAVAGGLLVFVGLSGALGWQLVARRAVWLSWPAWFALSLAVFYLGGLWSLALFLALGVCLEFVCDEGRARWPNALGLVVACAVVALAWHFLHLPEKPVNPLGTGGSLGFAILLFLVLPAGVVLLAALPDSRALAKPAVIAGVLLAGWAMVYAATDWTRKDLDTIEYCGASRQDERLLAVAAHLKTLPPDTEIRVHLALYHTGRLCQDLFAFPNRGSDDLLPGLQMGTAAGRPECETLLELGQVNDGEHHAQEGLEFDGNRPDLLRALAEVNILKDRPRAAAVFLNLLKQMPFQRVWAKAWLAELEQNPRLTGHADLDLMRSRMPRTDMPHTAVPVEDSMLQLLDSNPRNQMAFEYLMAFYLLSGDFQKLAKHAGQLVQLGYTVIPRNIEEGLLLGQRLYGVQFDLHGRAIQPFTIQRFQSFCDALGTTGKPTPAVIASLKPPFGDTFWYYYYSHMR